MNATTNNARLEVACLGLGTMGAAMAANLARAGHMVLAWNRTPGSAGAEAARAAGVEVVSTVADAVGGADVIVTCVSDDRAVIAIATGEGGVVDNAREGAILVDTSTIGPESARRLSASLRPAGITFLDAPVSGGDVGALNGTLTLMVGADSEEAFARCAPVFDAIGSSATHCGPVGAGQAVKLTNQILAAVNTVAVAEALTFAERLGVAPEIAIEVCSRGAGGSWSLQNLGPKMAAGEWGGGFKIDLMSKDIGLIGEVDGGLRLDALAAAKRAFARAGEVEAGAGEQGTQAVVRVLREPAE